MLEYLDPVALPLLQPQAPHYRWRTNYQFFRLQEKSFYHDDVIYVPNPGEPIRALGIDGLQYTGP
jgi:hypothetical protein